MRKQLPLKPEDFPVEADKNKLRTQNGRYIASAENESIAADMANRINEQAYREEQDRWSA